MGKTAPGKSVQSGASSLLDGHRTSVEQGMPCEAHHCRNLTVADGSKAVHPIGYSLRDARDGIFPATGRPSLFAVVCQKSWQCLHSGWMFSGWLFLMS